MDGNGTSSGTSAIASDRDSPRARLVQAAGTIRGRLFLLTLAVLLPAAFATALLVWDLYRSHRAHTERQMVETAHALSLTVDRQVDEASAVLQALSVSASLQKEDLAAFDREARQALLRPDVYVVLEDAHGVQRINTSLAPGVAPQSEPSTTFPRRWEQLLRKGETVSGLFPARRSRTPSVAVERLVRIKGEPRYGLILMMPSRSVARVFAEQGLPKGWLGGITDASQHLVARSRDNDRFAGMKIRPESARALERAPTGAFEAVSLEGVRTISAYTRSPRTGWTLFVAMPKAEMDASINRSLSLAVVLGLALVAVGAMLSLWFARAVVRPVEALAAGAAAMGRGEATLIPRSGVAETNAVAEALERSAAELKAREDDLRALNETLEARVQDATERLVQAQKLESIGRLTGGVAHDFNNLLTAVIGNLDLLSRRIGADEKLARYVANAKDAAARGARLTAQLLAFARQQRLHPQATDVNAVIEGMTTLLGSTLGGGVRVDTALAADLPAAQADRTQLELVILNLAINARDAMPRGGLLRIETDAMTVAEASRPSDPPPGRHVRISVIDEGAGMAPEVLARVFEPFFTTKGPGAGSGLGLSQALGVLQQLGGGLVMDSAQGRGTAARIFLPVAEAAAAPIAADAHATGENRLKGAKVLLVDDDPQVRGVAASLLRDAGAKVSEADGGPAALDIARQGEAFDLVLADYAMPGMNGAELATALAQLRPSTPILLMTGFADTAALSAAWRGPVLQKPFGAAELAAATAGVLAEASGKASA
ncbi:MAG: response regulator [Proteobacteria bacterium]|nr:response regulator [Pseudomonadota bacterium]